MNHHTLSDFRVGCAELLDRLLVEHLVALNAAGLVGLEKLTQDGVRIRANAGTGSFRREATLDRQMAQAEAVVEEFKREVAALASQPGATIEQVAVDLGRQLPQRGALAPPLAGAATAAWRLPPRPPRPPPPSRSRRSARRNWSARTGRCGARWPSCASSARS